VGAQVNRDHPMRPGQHLDVVLEEHTRHAHAVDQEHRRPGTGVGVLHDSTVTQRQLTVVVGQLDSLAVRD
jgi:hypothetical protein